METSRLAELTADLSDRYKDVPARLRERSAAWLSRTGWLNQEPPVVLAAPRRPAWQTGALWFAGGVTLAVLAGYFLDSQRGSLRRHMAYDRAMAAGRDLGDWSGKKARHWRNKAKGTIAERRGSGGAEETEGTIGVRL